MTKQNTKWSQITALLLLETTVSISWIAYHKYQPRLLELFGASALQHFLLIVQLIVLTVTPLIAGIVADRLRKKGTHSLPVVSFGISMAAMIFMAVAFVVFQKPQGDIMFYILPFMIVIWLISMNIFHSPALSMIDSFANSSNLPTVVAIFALTQDIIQALEPSIVDIIDYLGASVTFMIGGLLVFASGIWFVRTSKSFVPTSEEAAGKRTKSNLPVLLLLGLLMGVASAVFLNILPAWIQKEQGYHGSFWVSILLVIAAVISYPFGKLIEKIDLEKGVILGATALILVIIGIFTLPTNISLFFIALYPIVFAWVSISALPLAFSQSSFKEKVFGIGVYFAGIELINGLSEFITI